VLVEIGVGKLDITSGGIESIKVLLSDLLLTLHRARRRSIVVNLRHFPFVSDDLIKQRSIVLGDLSRIRVSELSIGAKFAPHCLQRLTLLINRLKHTIVNAIIHRVSKLSLRGRIKGILSGKLRWKFFAILGVLRVNGDTINHFRGTFVDLIVSIQHSSV